MRLERLVVELSLYKLTTARLFLAVLAEPDNGISSEPGAVWDAFEVVPPSGR